MFLIPVTRCLKIDKRGLLNAVDKGMDIHEEKAFRVIRGEVFYCKRESTGSQNLKDRQELAEVIYRIVFAEPGRR